MCLKCIRGGRSSGGFDAYQQEMRDAEKTIAKRQRELAESDTLREDGGRGDESGA